jgi:hypothetical protein
VADNEIGILVLPAMTGVGVEDQLRIEGAASATGKAAARMEQRVGARFVQDGR